MTRLNKERCLFAIIGAIVLGLMAIGFTCGFYIGKASGLKIGYDICSGANK